MLIQQIFRDERRDKMLRLSSKKYTESLSQITGVSFSLGGKNMEYIGTIEEFENNEIQAIYRRQCALLELMLLKDECKDAYSDSLYNEILNDLQRINCDKTAWWRKIANSHHWRTENADSWYVDFKTGNVSIEKCGK